MKSKTEIELNTFKIGILLEASMSFNGSFIRERINRVERAIVFSIWGFVFDG